MNRRIVILMIVLGLTMGTQTVFASDWDVAGKILTGVEGLRVLTGGRVDLIGSMTGMSTVRHPQDKGPRYGRRHTCSDSCRQWVPHYVWVKRWVPSRVEYTSRGHRKVIPGHYERYQVERGGHWAYVCSQYDPHRQYSCYH